MTHSTIALTVFSLLGALAAGACDEKPPPKIDRSGHPKTSSSPDKADKPAAAKAAPMGNPQRGKKLVKAFECNRCHSGTGEEPAGFHKDCFQCHRDIIGGKFKVADASKVARWKRNVLRVQHVPSLQGIGQHLRRDFIREFLKRPQDLRPHLVPSMPALALSTQQAADIAAYLGAPKPKTESRSKQRADSKRGRKLLEARACGGCHLFSGASLSTKPILKDNESNAAIELAPDLRHVRSRLTRKALIAWLVSPEKVKPGTLMPNLGLNGRQAEDIAETLLTARLGPSPIHKVPARLPKLQRKVSFAEVQKRVLSRTCAHCHGNPDIARGDGGPGNTGGFGFKPRGLDLSKYSGIASGLVADDGQRVSVFKLTESGMPRIVLALWARHEEQAGEPRADIRGMPMGMPPLPAKDIQLVESWIAQGRPR